METTCPHCGEGDINKTATSCPSCGESLGGGRPARRAREYDSYAVGRRVLRLAPAWLLLVVVAFGLALLLFSWVGRRGDTSDDGAFRNEATNQTAVTPEGAHAAASPLQTAPAAGATPAKTPEIKNAVAVPDEAGSYSVQVGAFADVSQANEQVSRLRAAGFEARVVEASEVTRFRFQVRSGLYATREAAARLASDLHARGVAGETVIVEPEKR
ncbi:MAG: SPOR domain-containing protein [Acidobacteria bacterium]|nr:SPOR domain-containing protein [Acidobacteriota bacterium]